jgi:hypothetical protein
MRCAGMKTDGTTADLAVAVNAAILREPPGLKQRPSTSKRRDGIRLPVGEGVDPATLRETDAGRTVSPLSGVLLRNGQDVRLIETAAFLARRG